MTTMMTNQAAQIECIGCGAPASLEVIISPAVERIDGGRREEVRPARWAPFCADCAGVLLAPHREAAA